MLTKNQFIRQLGSGHAVIDLNHPSPELMATLAEAGLGINDLRPLAGVDGQIKGKELEKLFAFVDRFDPNTSDKRIHLRDPAGELTVAGKLNQAFAEEARRNRERPQYAQPGSRSAPTQDPLTTADALVVPQAERLPEVSLGVRAKSQRQYAEENGLDPKTACRATAQDGIERFLRRTQQHPHRLAPVDQSIQVGYAEDTTGRLAVDRTQARLGREYIDRCLDAGYPVLVGVSHTDYVRNRGNADQLTDHWVTITARGYDDQGRLFYEFKDPGDGGTSRFFVDPDSGKLFREGKNKSSRWSNRNFEMTQVRTYRGLA